MHEKLLSWFYENRRKLPFREDPTPYHVWLSEVMLQQTRVGAMLPYYERFLAKLPTIEALARCPEDELFKLWEGLGYYSRARNLQKAARAVCEQYGGELPADHKALLALPGIGPYTAGAVASIAFGLPVPAVDGNVLRVFSRLYAQRGDVTSPAVKKALTARVMENQPTDRAGDYNQAIMELGALVCLPGTPKCEFCPLRADCLARQQGIAALLPEKPEKKPRRQETYTVCLVHSPDGWLLHKRGDEGLLSGLWEPVSLPGKLTAAQCRAELLRLGVSVSSEQSLEEAKHVFTHIVWHMTGFLLETGEALPLPPGYIWAGEDISPYSIPSAYAAYKKHMQKTEA